jgi:hypothetical protein
MIGVAIFFFLVFVFWRLFFKPKKKPIDFSKNADYYLAKYPDILTKPEPEPEPEKPNITINITHNHLHVYPPGEEKD